MTLITARIFEKPIDAHLLRAKLESEGIECYLADEFSVAVDPLISNAINGVKVKIKEEDTERVRAILNELDGAPYTDEQNRKIACPSCESTDVMADYNSVKGFSQIVVTIVSLLMMIYPFSLKKVFKCNSCDHEFKANLPS